MVKSRLINELLILYSTIVYASEIGNTKGHKVVFDRLFKTH